MRLNLSAMNSKTYVNEIDISKVSVGQKAEIEIDAFPGKKFGGLVKAVANMGEQLQNSNAKVFEVVVEVVVAHLFLLVILGGGVVSDPAFGLPISARDPIAEGAAADKDKEQTD